MREKGHTFWVRVREASLVSVKREYLQSFRIAVFDNRGKRALQVSEDNRSF